MGWDGPCSYENTTDLNDFDYFKHLCPAYLFINQKVSGFG